VSPRENSPVSTDPDEGALPAESIARNTGFALIARLASALGTGALTLFLVRALGPEGYGVFALALSAGALVLLPTDLGISMSTSRFVAEQHHDRAAAAGVVADAVKLKLIISGLFALALAAAAGPIAEAYGTHDLAWPVRIMAFAVFGQSFIRLYYGVFEAIGKVSTYLRIIVAESIAETGASIVFVLIGGGAAGAMLGRAAAYIFAGGFGLVVLARALGHSLIPRRSGGHGNFRRILGYGTVLLIVDGVVTLFSQIDVLLIGAIISVPAVALFAAPMSFLTILTYAGSAAQTGVAPRLARGPEGPNAEAFGTALRYVMLLQGLFIAPVLVWADPLTQLALGPDYGDSAGVLRALAPYAFLIGPSPLISGAVDYLGAARGRVPIAIGALLLNFVIDIVLLPRIGIVAGAIGTTVAYSLYVAAQFWICWRILRIALRPLGLALVRTLAAAGAMAAVLAAFGVSHVSLPLLIGGGALGVAVYVIALTVLRAVTVEELQRGLRTLRRLRPQPVKGAG
jgi:O-antigen/teichoic acid export membrane protein